MLDELRGQDTVELISAFAYRLPLMVIADMLGVPMADREQVHIWSDLIGRNRGGTERSAILPARTALREFRAYMAELVAARRGRPAEEDLVAALLDANQGEQLSEDRARGNVRGAAVRRPRDHDEPNRQRTDRAAAPPGAVAAARSTTQDLSRSPWRSSSATTRRSRSSTVWPCSDMEIRGEPIAARRLDRDHARRGQP